MSNYDDDKNNIYNSIREIYGNEDELKDKIVKIDSLPGSPYLTIDKYQDPTGKIKLYYQTYVDCFKKQKKEKERLDKEIREKKLFDEEKALFQRWLDRKSHFEKHNHGPFLEPSPRVSDNVKNLLLQQTQDALKEKMEKELLNDIPRNNGQHISEDIKVKQEKKSEEESIQSPLNFGNQLLPPPPPPPPIPKAEPPIQLSRSSPTPLPPPPVLHSLESIPSSSTDTSRIIPNTTSSEASPYNISDAKKRDLDLFGDDEEFAKLDPANITNNLNPSPTIQSNQHKKKRSRSKSQSPVLSPKRHKKEKKEKKKDKEKKEKKEKKKDKERDRDRDREKRDKDTNSVSEKESEKSHHHKHKKHKKHDKDYV